MAKQVETEAEAKDQLWSRLESGRISMLSIPGAGQLPQPMTHFTDRETGCFWFIASSESELAACVQPMAIAQLVFMAPSEDYQASLSGRLETVTDDEKLDALWNTSIAAWFEGGRDDPTVRLLRFTPDEAAVWATEGSKILVGLKVLRAGMTEGAQTPDVSVHRLIDFNEAA